MNAQAWVGRDSIPERQVNRHKTLLRALCDLLRLHGVWADVVGHTDLKLSGTGISAAIRRGPYLHAAYPPPTDDGPTPARLDVSIYEEQDGTRHYVWADDNAYPVVAPEKAADALATALGAVPPRDEH